jgi:hypothetical protein
MGIVTPFIAYLIINVLVRELVNRCNLLLRLYWGKYYLKGIWTYYYTDRQTEDKKFGIITIDQDIEGIHFASTGLFCNETEIGGRRSDTKSAHDAIFSGHKEIIFFTERRDHDLANSEPFYTKIIVTIGTPAKRRKISLKYTNHLNAYATVYGGGKNGQIHSDAEWFKEQDVKTELEARKLLIERMRKIDSTDQFVSHSK